MDANKALESGKVCLDIKVIQVFNYLCTCIIYGVKGYSSLHAIPSFDLIRCIPVDYMHCVLLAVGKKMATLWFDSSHNKQEW